MRTSRFVKVVAATAVVTGVVAAGAVYVHELGVEPERVQVADLASATTTQAKGAAEKVAAAAPQLQVPVVSPVQKFVAKPAAPKASCSKRKGNVTLQVDALVHAIGVKGGTVRSEAAESKVVARAGRGNACKSVRLFMGEDYAFEGRLPYGNWVLDVSLSGARQSLDLVVDRAAVAAPKQLLDGDCGGVASVQVLTRTEDSELGLSGPLPATLVTAKRVPDGECAIPGQLSFTTGADGSFVGSIGYGDWMFTMTTPSGRISDFVTVGKNSDEIVLTRTVDLLG